MILATIFKALSIIIGITEHIEIVNFLGKHFANNTATHSFLNYLLGIFLPNFRTTELIR